MAFYGIYSILLENVSCDVLETGVIGGCDVRLYLMVSLCLCLQMKQSFFWKKMFFALIMSSTACLLFFFVQHRIFCVDYGKCDTLYGLITLFMYAVGCFLLLSI